MSRDKQVGDHIGPYLLTGVLGEGGAGLVFRAKWDPPPTPEGDPPFEPPEGGVPSEVAIKLLRPAHASSEAIFHRFVREIGLAQRIHHPHIVQHLDSGLADNFLYYAMELVPYGSLREIVQRRGALPWRDAVESAAHIADALACLHDAGVVHRDLKPDNVFLSETGGLKLGDFGLAMIEDGAQLTMAGQTVGSVRYMAPEQVKGRRDLDGRCDLYALGCVIFEMCTGRPPFESTDPMVVFYKHVEEPPPKIRALSPDVPESLEELVDRLLEKDKHHRPPSAHGVRAALAAMHSAGDDGRIENLDDLLIGDVAEIEAAPEYPEDSMTDSSLAGLTTSPAGGLSGSLNDSDLLNAAPQPDPSPSMPQGKTSDLSQRLAEGCPEAPKANPAMLIGVLVAVAVGIAAALFMSGSGDGGDGKADEPQAETTP